ncbi:MAG: hypothetical protein M0024_10425 [Nitrospiraceae bacterium]|nr:hypothetical protein [Nitrospiraceae bacterium]
MRKKTKQIAAVDSRFKLIPIGQIEMDPRSPLFNVPVSEERRAALKELLPLQSKADAVKVYKKVLDDKEIFVPLDQYEFLQVAFLEFAENIWCQEITGLTDIEAYLLMARLQGMSDHWTMFDSAVYLRNGLDLLGDDIEGALARYARETGCSKANATHLHQVGIVAKFLQSQLSPDKYSSLRTKGTHLRYIYPAPQSKWTELSVNMLNHDWSTKTTEAEVKKYTRPVSAESAKPVVEKCAPVDTQAVSNYQTAAGVGTEAQNDDTSTISPVATLAAINKEIIHLQTSLMQLASNVERAWGDMTDGDKEAVINIGNHINANVTELFNMFGSGYPLHCLIHVDIPSSYADAAQGSFLN